MRALALYVLLVCVWSANSVQENLPCVSQNRACPVYTVLLSTPEYEVRRYAPSTWVTTSLEASSSVMSRKTRIAMYMKLRGYITGANSENREIPMALPVVTKIESLESGRYKITRMFYLPDDFHGSNAPTPSSTDVELLHSPESELYVRTFSKRTPALNADYLNNANELRAAIDNPATYGSNVYYRAAYNRPSQVGMKHYEVWLDKTA